MSFDFAELKRFARQQIHETLAVDALYSHPSLAVAQGVRVRWHDKIQLNGELGGRVSNGYAQVLEGIDQIVFDRCELAEVALVLKRGGVVEIHQYEVRFTLDTMSPHDGPINEVWQVTRL